MAANSTKRRENGINHVVNLLESSKTRIEIVKEITTLYKISEGGVDKWIKAAKEILTKRQAQVEAIRIRETEAIITEAVRNGLKSNIEIEQRLLQIGWAEIEVEETTFNKQFGTTTFRRHPTPAEQRSALETVLKMRGGFAAENLNIKFTPVTGMEIK